MVHRTGSPDESEDVATKRENVEETTKVYFQNARFMGFYFYGHAFGNLDSFSHVSGCILCESFQRQCYNEDKYLKVKLSQSAGKLLIYDEVIDR